jgi:Putative phage metallopeptidase
MPEQTTRLKRHALILRWQEPHDPLPVRVIQPTRPGRTLAWFEGQSSADSGQPAAEPFHFCVHVQRLLKDIALRCADFRHLQAMRILVSVIQARGDSTHGLQARITPLRFPKGKLTRQLRGVPFHIQRYFLGEHEFLYVLTFCLPRYLEQDFDQKIVTLFHELYHISPDFDGDLRRHGGRYHMHSHSQRDYDNQMVQYARSYLASRPDPNLHGFLRMNFAQLQARHGAVTGVVVPRPKIIPLIGPHAPAPSHEHL